MSLLSENNIKNNLSIGDWVNNVEMLHKNEDGEELKIQFCRIPLTLSMRSKFITILQAMLSLLDDA